MIRHHNKSSWMFKQVNAHFCIHSNQKSLNLQANLMNAKEKYYIFRIAVEHRLNHIVGDHDGEQEGD